MPVEKGNVVSVHYRGTLESGEEFDSSYSREEPLVFEAGASQVIPGFDAAILGMEVGETKTVSLPVDEGYGEAHDDRIHEVPRSQLPAEFVITEGAQIQAQNETGVFTGVVSSYTDENVILDFNHPLAGKALNFDIEIVGIEEN
jgi:peptidylprolyl isomerase